MILGRLKDIITFNASILDVTMIVLDLHIHSIYSIDSLLRPDRIIRAAKRKGLDGIAITDHNTMKGGALAAKLTQKGDFTAIIGAEMRVQEGEILGLFLNEELNGKTALEIIDDIHGQGGVAVLPHPFRGQQLDEEICRRVDVLEVFNSRSSIEQNLASLTLARRINKPGIAGSDAHFCSEIGNARTIIESDNFDILKCLLSGNVKLQTSYSSLYKKGVSQIIQSFRKNQLMKIPVQMKNAFVSITNKRK